MPLTCEKTCRVGFAEHANSVNNAAINFLGAQHGKRSAKIQQRRQKAEERYVCAEGADGRACARDDRDIGDAQGQREEQAQVSVDS